MDWIDVARDLEPYLRRGDLDYGIKHVAQVMSTIPQTPFHLVLTSHFSNDSLLVAGHFDTFYAGQSDFVPAAVYAETNGFYINPDRWYFEMFGYKAYGGHEDHDWLSEWDAMYPETITLTGMESLQQVYTEYKIIPDDANPALQLAKDFSDLMILFKFQKLIQQSAPLMRKVRCPVLATSHDYDTIVEIIPSPVE